MLALSFSYLCFDFDFEHVYILGYSSHTEQGRGLTLKKTTYDLYMITKYILAPILGSI